MAYLREVIAELSKHTSEAHKRFVLLLVLVGAALRAWMLFLPITHDEAFAWAWYASRPTGFIISEYSHPANQVLHTLLSKWSTTLFGLHEITLRLPAYLAGVLMMPMAYVFVRSLFNRYIALLTLALLASSGGLIEYSALARGYSIGWATFLAALMLGRHFNKTANPVSALLMALVLALGMWAEPSTVFSALTVFLWVLGSAVLGDKETVGIKLPRLGMSFLAFILLTILCYAPVVAVHGVDMLFEHMPGGVEARETFRSGYQDSTFDLWAYVNDTAATWLSFLGLAGLLHAAYVSTKFRLLLVSQVLATVPLVLALGLLLEPRVWMQSMFVLHLSSAIALFYLLKLVQERIWEGFSKRMRTLLMSAVLCVGFAYLAMPTLLTRMERHPEAGEVAVVLVDLLHPGDRVATMWPVDAPVEFAAAVQQIPRAFFRDAPLPNGTIYVLVAQLKGQTVESVMEFHDLGLAGHAPPQKLREWKGLEIFALPAAQASHADHAPDTHVGGADGLDPEGSDQ